MPANSDSPVNVTEVFKALGDPIRWSIVQQMAAVDELACSTLEDVLPISKPTISYHTKILSQAGLIETRKQGRNFFYTLRREVLQEVMDEVWTLAPQPRPVSVGRDRATVLGRRRRSSASAPRLKQAVGDESVDRDVTLLTW